MKKLNIQNKKADVSISFLIGVIILVISFGVILIFIFLFPFGASIDKETCHQSIVYRATSKEVTGGVLDISESIPLKCQTEKICLTMSGEDCKGLSSTKKNPVAKIELSKDKDRAKDKIIEVFGDSLVSCHSMVGEGKLNFLPHNWLKLSDANYGLICTRIAFDPEAIKQINSINYGELYVYLERKSVGDKSALEYLYPGVDFSKFAVIYTAIKDKNEESKKMGLPVFKEWNMNLAREGNSGYAVIASIATKSQSKALLKSTGVTAVVGTALLWTGIGSPIGAILLAGSAGAITFWYDFEDKYSYAPPTIRYYDVKELQKLKIFNFEIAP